MIAAFDGGCTTSEGGVTLLGGVERPLGIAVIRFAACAWWPIVAAGRCGCKV